MWTAQFWKAAIERAVKTFAQTLLAVLSLDGLDWLSVNWGDTFLTAGIAAALSVLSSVVTGVATDGSPSMTDAEKLTPPAVEPRL